MKDRVRVLSGEFGNARGFVYSMSGDTAQVSLDSERRAAPREFEVSNLTHARGNFDR